MIKYESRYITTDCEGTEYEHIRRIVHVGSRMVTHRWCKLASESKWTHTSRTTERTSEWNKSWDAANNWQVENFTPVKGVRQSDKPWTVRDYTK